MFATVCVACARFLAARELSLRLGLKLAAARPRVGVQVARELGENMTDEEIWEMIQAGDLDKDGMINEDEFLRILKKGLAAA